MTVNGMKIGGAEAEASCSSTSHIDFLIMKCRSRCMNWSIEASGQTAYSSIKHSMSDRDWPLLLHLICNAQYLRYICTAWYEWRALDKTKELIRRFAFTLHVTVGLHLAMANATVLLTPSFSNGGTWHNHGNGRLRSALTLWEIYDQWSWLQ